VTSLFSSPKSPICKQNVPGRKPLPRLVSFLYPVAFAQSSSAATCSSSSRRPSDRKTCLFSSSLRGEEALEKGADWTVHYPFSEENNVVKLPKALLDTGQSIIGRQEQMTIEAAAAALTLHT
jgi:hypothetical protein